MKDAFLLELKALGKASTHSLNYSFMTLSMRRSHESEWSGGHWKVGAKMLPSLFNKILSYQATTEKVNFVISKILLQPSGKNRAIYSSG